MHVLLKGKGEQAIDKHVYHENRGSGLLKSYMSSPSLPPTSAAAGRIRLLAVGSVGFGPMCISTLTVYFINIF